jgi:hypothetical protein
VKFWRSSIKYFDFLSFFVDKTEDFNVGILSQMKRPKQTARSQVHWRNDSQEAARCQGLCFSFELVCSRTCVSK